ncbi:MAG: DUF3810 domain-containing protein [Clostridiales bacterium]|jgi:hypothetical protein|nr:DUF3810 domain-containing protein [Clostridiales bacterium]
MFRIVADYISTYRKTFAYAGICFATSVILIFLARTSQIFAQLYATSVFPIFQNTIGRLFSPIPFSVLEILIYATLILALYKLIKIIIFRKSKLISKFFRQSICFLCSILLIFTLTASINYSRATFADETGLYVPNRTTEDLIKLSLMFIEDISGLLEQINIDENNLFILDRSMIHENAITAMKTLGERYPQLRGYYPNPKAIIFSNAMSYLGITGIYSPFTMEANYNNDVADYIIPFTICHELSHFKGFMREDEANFIAYLACNSSDSAEFKYSGKLNALIYTLRALNDHATVSEYMAVYDLIPDQIKAEIIYNNLYWYERTTPVTTMAKAANDQYLQANAQADGVSSYGRIVDLLLAEYADQINNAVLL